MCVGVFSAIHIFKQSRSDVFQKVPYANAGRIYLIAASCLDSEEPFSAGVMHKLCRVLSDHHIKGHMMSACAIISDIKGEAF